MSNHFTVFSRLPLFLHDAEAQEHVAPSPPSGAGPADDLELLAARLVGTHAVDRAQHRLKRAMLVEALARTRGNYSRAARLLGVTRQAVQQMVARYELRPLAAAARTPHEPREASYTSTG